VKSYQLNVLGHTPNVHLIPSRNANDQTKSIPSLPFSTTQYLKKSSQPFPCSHSHSKFRWHPHLGQSIPWKGFLKLEDTKTKAYPFLKITILVIECSWKFVDTIGYQCPTLALLLKLFTGILLHFPIPFTVASNSCSQFQPPNRACS